LACQKMTPLRGMTPLRKKCRYKGIRDTIIKKHANCQFRIMYIMSNLEYPFVRLGSASALSSF
jgi:hypothetical protein